MKVADSVTDKVSKTLSKMFSRDGSAKGGDDSTAASSGGDDSGKGNDGSDESADDHDNSVASVRGDDDSFAPAPDGGDAGASDDDTGEAGVNDDESSIEDGNDGNSENDGSSDEEGQDEEEGIDEPPAKRARETVLELFGTLYASVVYPFLVQALVSVGLDTYASVYAVIQLTPAYTEGDAEPSEVTWDPFYIEGRERDVGTWTDRGSAPHGGNRRADLRNYVGNVYDLVNCMMIIDAIIIIIRYSCAYDLTALKDLVRELSQEEFAGDDDATNLVWSEEFHNLPKLEMARLRWLIFSALKMLDAAGVPDVRGYLRWYIKYKRYNAVRESPFRYVNYYYRTEQFKKLSREGVEYFVHYFLKMK